MGFVENYGLIFPGCPLSLRSICRLTIRSLLGRERLGVISKLKQDKYLSQELLDFLMYRRFNPIEAFLSTPEMKSMLTSLTYLMDNVSPKGNRLLYAKSADALCIEFFLLTLWPFQNPPLRHSL